MQSPPQKAPKQVFEWPLWAHIYVYIIGIPMIVISAGLTIWLFISNVGVISSGTLGNILLFVSFLISFTIGALMFFSAAQRILSKESEAMSFASSAHLLLVLPSVTILLVRFVQQETIFLSILNRSITERVFEINGLLIVWVIFHTYFALVLALNDNTARFVIYEDE